MPETFQGDGFRFFWDAAPVLIDLFGEELDRSRPDLFRLLVGSAQLPFFRGPVQVDKGDVVRHAESVLPHPGQDRTVIREDRVGLFLFHPGDDGRFVELIDEEGLDFGEFRVGVLPGQIAGEPAAFHLGVDKFGHGQSDSAMSAFLTLIHCKGECVELAVRDSMNGDFSKRVAEGNGGKRIPRKGERHSVRGQGGEEKAANATNMHRARKIGWGFFARPEGFDSVPKSGGSGGGSDQVASERWIFLPAFEGGE